MSAERSGQVIDVMAKQAADGRRREAEGAAKPWFTLLFAAFVVVDLLAIVLGVNAYRGVTSQQAASEREQLALGPIVSTVRANDADGAVARGDGPEGPSLVLVQALDSGTYETRIYLYQGHIVEEYALSGAPYTPDKATELAASDSFSFDYDDGLLTISTDAGTASVGLRSARDAS